MTFAHSVTPQKNMLRSFSFFVLFLALLMVNLFFLSTSARAATANNTTTTLAVSPASVTAGSPVTLTATVTSGGSPLTSGQVAFCNAAAAHCTDSALLGTVWVTTSGTATLRRSFAPGTTNVQAVYLATNAYATSSSITQAVGVTGTVSLNSGDMSIQTPQIAGSQIVTGDFNNDGYPDVAVIGTNNTSFQVFFGTANGNLTAGPITTVTGTPGQAILWNVAVADLNGDGNVDLAINTGNSVAILLGNGDGTFTQKSPVLTDGSGSVVFDLAIGDFNGDGKADVVYYDPYNHALIVFFGNGDGTFSAANYVFGITGSISDIKAADFNGDGKTDLAISSSDTSDVLIFLGNGDGTFTKGASVALSGGSLAVSGSGKMAIGDFNGDGNLDLAITEEGNSSTIQLFLGNGDGTFTAGTPVSTGLSIARSGLIVVGDFNGDGKSDLAVNAQDGTANSSSVAILFGNGDGTFGMPNIFSEASEYAEGLVVGDFNGDGLSDLARVNSSSITIISGTAVAASKTTPIITWADPASIVAGTALSATQLNATASVPGTFTYTPAAGTVLAAGTQTLSVVFTPTDSTAYNNTSDSLLLAVTPAIPPSYTFTPSSLSVVGSSTITLALVSTNYAGTVSFTTSISSMDGNAADLSASAPSVTLTTNGKGSAVLTITASSRAASHPPMAPWTSGATLAFGAVLLGAPAAARRKQVLAVLLTAAAIILMGFSVACGNSGTGGTVSKTRLYSILVTPTGTGTVTNPPSQLITVSVQ
jgi:hypothetical protein